VNLIGFGIENAGNFDALSFEAMDQIGAIEAVNVFAVFSGGQYEISAEMLNAVHGAGVGGSAHGLRLQHFFVRPGQGMHVHGALAVGYLSAEDA
jgi:hypothetical protein